MAMPEVLDRRVYAAGELIFKEGDVGRSCAYLVERGRVQISKRAGDGQDRVLGDVPAGGIFGEMALLDNSPRMAKAVAAEATTVVIITAATFEQKLKAADPFLRGLLQILARNVRDLADKLINGQD